MPDPPEPTFPSTFLTAIAALVWRYAGVSDPSGTQLGHLVVNATGAVTHICPADNGGLGTCRWYLTGSPSAGIAGLLFTSADATKMLAATAVNANGTIQSGGVAYKGTQYGYSNGQIVLKLAI